MTLPENSSPNDSLPWRQRARKLAIALLGFCLVHGFLRAVGYAAYSLWYRSWMESLPAHSGWRTAGFCLELTSLAACFLLPGLAAICCYRETV